MKKYSWILLLLVFFGILMARNFLFPLFVDDYSYSFIWTEKYGNLIDYDKMPNEVPNFERVKSISDIAKSQYNHYMNWGARPIADSILQYFLMFDKNIFNEVPRLKVLDLPYYTEMRAMDEFFLENCDLLESPYNHCNVMFAAYYNLKQIVAK